MEFSLEGGATILSRTPAVLHALLGDLPEGWTTNNEGPATWSPYQVVGHLAYVEESDWMDRTLTILADGGPHKFEAIDREAEFSRYEGWPLSAVLERFSDVRRSNLLQLDELVVNDDLGRIGVHPDFGEVTLRQLLASWVVHDFNHLDQIAKTMAKHYTRAVGPWRAYLPIIDA